MDPLRSGKKLQHRDRKNGASREQWLKRKAARNSARGVQVYVEDIPDNDMTQTIKRYDRSPF